MFIKYSNFGLCEMSSISGSLSGIDDIFIWVGEKNPRHGHRIKVSNIKGSYSKNDTFSIRLHDLTIDGNQKIDKKSLKKVKNFILLNKNIIEDFSNAKISFYDFIKKIKSV